jgi:hypothetical protein
MPPPGWSALASPDRRPSLSFGPRSIWGSRSTRYMAQSLCCSRRRRAAFGELLEELPAFLLRGVEEARHVQLEHVEGDEAERTITAAGHDRTGKFVELGRASGSGNQLAVEHGVGSEGGERPGGPRWIDHPGCARGRPRG